MLQTQPRSQYTPECNVCGSYKWQNKNADNKSPKEMLNPQPFYPKLRLKVDSRQIAGRPPKCMQMYAHTHTHTYLPLAVTVRFLIPFTFFWLLQRRLSVLRQQDVRGPESIMQLRCEREQMEFRRGLLPGTAQFRHNQHVLPAAKGSGRRGAGTHHTRSLGVCGNK